MNNKFYIETPVYKSHKLNKEHNKSVFYKMECYQPTGSFKIRGMEELCRFHINNGKRDFIASSGGNAGYSLGYIGQKMGVDITVIVPKTTSQFMINKMTNLGTQVEVYGDVWDEAHQYALKISEERGAVYVSPFDDPLLWKGHSTLIDECAKQIPQPDKIIVSVGGGGLLCGVLQGIKRNGWHETTVITTETIGAASFYKSYQAKEIVELDEIKTIATSLGAKKVAEKSLQLAYDLNVTPFMMSDNEAIRASLDFLDEYNVWVEPACGAAISVPYFYPQMIKEDETALVIVCGGVNIPIKNITHQAPNN
ncbi:pyridoxal-phosphate dependent enzyme [Aquimarina sediminis]|uniref:pyridoxal-phosphate dependent enzyme n=1 Tax=Aquimarina sediminis TaxID=2070536 RepID=UPI000CA07777|nr:pyridoxal-phosphate dependent enzyme [Aquimarina sediminis]